MVNQHASTAHLIFHQQILQGTVRDTERDLQEDWKKAHFSKFSWGLTPHVATGS